MKERFAKVLLWRFLSILITFSTIFVINGDIQSTTQLTLLLHFFLIVGHFLFETVWDYKIRYKNDLLRKVN